jgi:glycine/D-amino acid oxidase-like deaminating enzyme
MKTRYTTPYWLDTTSERFVRAWPALRGAVDADVAIVGGGMTGSLAAYAFAGAGVRVALVEAERIGRGATAASLGSITQEPDASFRELRALHGLRAARHVGQATRRAALDFAALLRRLPIRGDLTGCDYVRFAAGPDQVRRASVERQARREAGLDAAWLSAQKLNLETGVEADGALVVRGQSQVDPFRACLEVARAAAARGARLFEQSAAVRIRFSRKNVDIFTARGSIRARAVVVATGYPPRDVSQLRRHLKALTTYAVATERLPAAVRHSLGRRPALLADFDAPPHALRCAGDNRVIFGGAEQRPVPPQSRAKTLVQRTGQLMYELTRIYPAISGLRPEYGWDSPIVRTADGVMYAGPHRNFPRHLFAFGLGSSLASSYLAARILLRCYAGEPDKADEVFGFARVLER